MEPPPDALATKGATIVESDLDDRQSLERAVEGMTRDGWLGAWARAGG